MLTKVFRSLVIAAIFAAMGCSNRAPNTSSPDNDKSTELRTAQPKTVTSKLVIDDAAPIGATLSDRHLDVAKNEVKFSMVTDQPVNGRNEFIVSVYSHQIGPDRFVAGYSLADRKGHELWRSEYAAQTSDMSWVKLSRSNREHSWSLEIDATSASENQIHRLDKSVLVLDNQALDGSSNNGDFAQLEKFYSDSDPLFDDASEQLIISALSNGALLPWIAGANGEISDPEGPQQIIIDWVNLACEIIDFLHEEFCSKSPDALSICKVLGLLSRLCSIVRVIDIF